MRKWFRDLFALCRYQPTSVRNVWSINGELINRAVARHTDTPGMVTLILQIPAATVEVSWAPETARNVARALFEAARDSQDLAPVVDVE